MKKFLPLLGMILLISGFSVAQMQNENARTVLVAELRGTIDPASASYLEMALREAELKKAQALIVELDTPGGLVSSVRTMAQAIDKSKIPVVVYVTPAGASATSAGALLSLASHVAAMAPGTNIGAAHPVDAGGKDIQGAMAEKAVNDTAAFARGLAELRKRNPNLAEQVVRKSASLTAQQALSQNLIEIVAADRTELLQKIHGRHGIQSDGAVVQNVEMTWGQKILHLLANPNIATMLMGLGVLCIYIELTTPGVIIPGIVGGVSIIVALISFQMLPIRTGGLLLLLLGVGLMIAEAFVVSGGALAAGGILSFLLGILWIMDPAQTAITISPAVWVPVVVALAAGIALIAFAAARLKRQVAQAQKMIGGGGAAGLMGYVGKVEIVDSSGRHGKLVIRGETWDFEAADDVKIGELVEVSSVSGMRVFVKKVVS